MLAVNLTFQSRIVNMNCTQSSNTAIPLEHFLFCLAHPLSANITEPLETNLASPLGLILRHIVVNDMCMPSFSC